ncbi:uroporphyrinogen-III synthase [Alteromonas sp. SM 2104]|nr:uroporphyrinogen-III synthase [Alteromonas oceanisediminis]MBT0586796.1 uroporphyrinogen-III synthase [Alteromonas oceanisediminis]
MQDIVLEPEAITQLHSLIRQRRQAFDHAIVTSQYAVDGLARAMRNESEPVTLANSIIAVGVTTQQKLQALPQLSQTPILRPLAASAEGILAMSELESMHACSVLLIKGQGGREILSDTLRKRGAIVHEAAVYSRSECHPQPRLSPHIKSALSGVIVTNGEAISLLLAVPENNELKQLPWVVVSQRNAEIAKGYGIEEVYISAGATDAALLKCLQQITE